MAAGAPVTLQFEDFPIPCGAVVANDDPGYAGSGFVDYTQDDGLVVLPLNVPEAGQYEIEVRYANGSASSRPLEIFTQKQLINPRLQFPSTGSWPKWGTVKFVAQLKPGDDAMGFDAIGQNGPNLDALTYTLLPSPLPEGTTVQAESFRSIGGAIAADNHPGYTGEGSVDFVVDQGGSVELSLPEKPAGTYAFDVRYANGGNTTRYLGVGTNFRGLSNVAFVPTGGWAVWKTVTFHLPFATANGDVLHFGTTGTPAPNLDAVTFRKVSVDPAVNGETQAERSRLSGVKPIVGVVRNSDQGYADYTGGPGSFIEWTLDASTATTGQLEWRYSNGSGSARPLELRVNDSLIDVLSFAPTPSWSFWSGVNIAVPLTEGANRIRLTAVGADGPNIDFLTARPFKPLT